LAAVWIGLLAAGCLPAARAPYRCPVSHYAAPGGAVLDLERVVFVPLANETVYPGAGEGLDEELLRAIQCRRLFHLELAPPSARFASDHNAKALTLQELAALRNAVTSDAVLIGAVTHFRPPPQMQLGLYLRLLDLRQGRLLWAVDYLWDAASRDTQDRIAAFHDGYLAASEDPLGWQMATVSPRAFQKFVAWEVAQTLPVRPVPDAAQTQAVAVSGDCGRGPPISEKSSQVPSNPADNTGSVGVVGDVDYAH
jgi:hypothetical protein